jgi:hypothetical protein
MRDVVEALATEKRVSATGIQTVGVKGYDGFLLARLEENPSGGTERSRPGRKPARRRAA